MTAKPSLDRCNRHGLIPICCLLLLLLVVWVWQTWVNVHLLFVIWWLQFCCCGSMSLVEIGWLPTSCLLFSHLFWSSELGRCGLIPTCCPPCYGHTFLWSCEPSTDGFCKPYPILCPLFCGCTLPISKFSGHGLILICRPPLCMDMGWFPFVVFHLVNLGWCPVVVPRLV